MFEQLRALQHRRARMCAHKGSVAAARRSVQAVAHTLAIHCLPRGQCWHQGSRQWQTHSQCWQHCTTLFASTQTHDHARRPVPNVHCPARYSCWCDLQHINAASLLSPREGARSVAREVDPLAAGLAWPPGLDALCQRAPRRLSVPVH